MIEEFISQLKICNKAKRAADYSRPFSFIQKTHPVQAEDRRRRRTDLEPILININ